MQQSPNYPDYFVLANLPKILRSSMDRAALSKCSAVMEKQSSDYKGFVKRLETLEFASERESRAIASFMGLLLGDSLGAFTEFLDFDQKRRTITNKGFEDLHNNMNNPKLVNRRRQNSIELGMHTDDCSMAKCLAESLLVNNLDLDGLDVRLRYILWWYYGYCNGTLDQPSFGLGSNIHLSLNEFLKQPAPFMDLNGPRQNNGNGGLMRLAPCALVGSHNKESYTQEQVVKLCKMQSRTTHDGLEAEECCKLLGLIIHKALGSELKGAELKESILNQLPQLYKPFMNSGCQSVMYLCESRPEPEQNLKLYDPKYNISYADRFWDWKSNQMVLPPARTYKSDYYGSYCMDCMYISLYIVHKTNSFQDALIMSANLGGDCDSFGAVVGQICGAIYGMSPDLLDLYHQRPRRFDGYHTPYLAYRLHHGMKSKLSEFYRL